MYFQYLSHRAVIKSDHSTTKLRIVFDASVHYPAETCLNDILDAGPCLLPYLLDVLLRFRTGKFTIVANIKQALFQSGCQILLNLTNMFNQKIN